jgi:hypothetical protein
MYESPYTLDIYAKGRHAELVKDAQAYRLARRVSWSNRGFPVLSSIGDALIGLGQQLKLRSASRTTASL